MDILIIGGGDNAVYKPRNKYFEVGYHPTSDYGSGLDWNNPSFWESLIDLLLTLRLKFRCIIMDEGSSCHLPNDIFFYNIFILLCQTFLVDDGVIIMEVYPSDAILNSLHIELLKNFYRIGYFKSTGNTADFFIYSKTNTLQDSVITNTKGIYTGYFFAIEKKKGQLSPEEWSDFLKTKKSEAPNWFSASFSIALVSRKDILPITKNMKDFIRERILNVHDEDDEKIERPFKISPKRSAKKSPKRSAKRSLKKSPKRSAKRSAKKSPKRSAKRSLKISPKRSAKRSPKKSPKRSSKRLPKRSSKNKRKSV